MVAAPAFDERDRARQRGAVAGAEVLCQRGDVDGRAFRQTHALAYGSYLCRFTKASLCVRFERCELILRNRPENLGFDANTRVFKATPNICDSLPINGILDGLEVR